MKNLFMPNEWDALQEAVHKWKRRRIKLIFTNGCFDILHEGHLALLKFAGKQKGRVIVGLNSDNSVTKLKGHDRPVNGIRARAENLLNTKWVDAVAVFDEDTPQELITHIQPDILIKGDDYHFATTVGAEDVTARGGQVLFFKKIEGLSTTNIITASHKNTETKNK